MDIRVDWRHGSPSVLGVSLLVAQQSKDFKKEKKTIVRLIYKTYIYKSTAIRNDIRSGPFCMP